MIGYAQPPEFDVEAAGQPSLERRVAFVLTKAGAGAGDECDGKEEAVEEREGKRDEGYGKFGRGRWKVRSRL